MGLSWLPPTVMTLAEGPTNTLLALMQLVVLLQTFWRTPTTQAPSLRRDTVFTEIHPSNRLAAAGSAKDSGSRVIRRPLP